MVDYNQVVSCMCSDVGFPVKLFRCGVCRNRLRYSYCSNYYIESSEQMEQCNWCQSEARINCKHMSSSRKSASGSGDNGMKLEYSDGDKVKQHNKDDPEDHKARNNPMNGAPSPGTRRYNLLKDAMC